MRFLILLSLIITVSCGKKKSVRAPAGSAGSENSTIAPVGPGSAVENPGQTNPGFDGNLEQVVVEIADTPLNDLIGDSELVPGVDPTELGADQVLVDENGDVILPNPPPGLSLADSSDDVEVETKKNSDGSQETIVKDKGTGKVISKESINSSGTKIIQTQIDPNTSKPIREVTINLSPTKVDGNGNAVIESKVVKDYYADGTIMTVTTHGEDGKVDSIEYHNEKGSKVRDEQLADDGTTILSQTIYNDDGTKQTTVWDPATGKAVLTKYDGNGNAISTETTDSPAQVSNLIDNSGKFINQISGFYRATTWNVKKLGDKKDGESCDSCGRERSVPLQPYQEQTLPVRDEKGFIVRDESGAAEQKTVYPAFCGLAKVLFNDVHGNSEHTGCGIGKYATNNSETDVSKRNENAAFNGLYSLDVWKNNDSDAYCEAMCWQLETALQPFPIEKEVTETQKEKIIDDPDGRKFCFLDKIQFTNLDKSDGPGSCRVYRDDKEKAWYVESKVFKKAQAVCSPGCFDIGEDYVAVDVEEIIAARANGDANKDDFKEFTTGTNNTNTTYQDKKAKEGTSALSTVCGITGVLMADIDDGKEVFNCKLTGGDYLQEESWKDFIANRESAGISELANKKLRWTLWAGLNGGDDDDTSDPLSADGQVNDGLVQGDYSDNGQDQYGECHAICFQIKHDCDNDGKADKNLEESCTP